MIKIKCFMGKEMCLTCLLVLKGEQCVFLWGKIHLKLHFVCLKKSTGYPQFGNIHRTVSNYEWNHLLLLCEKRLIKHWLTLIDGGGSWWCWMWNRWPFLLLLRCCCLLPSLTSLSGPASVTISVTIINYINDQSLSMYSLRSTVLCCLYVCVALFTLACILN